MPQYFDDVVPEELVNQLSSSLQRASAPISNPVPELMHIRPLQKPFNLTNMTMLLS